MRSILAISMAVALTASNAYAQKGQGHGPKVKPANTHVASAPKTQAPKAHAPAPKAHAPSPKAHAPKTPKGGSHVVAKGGNHKTTTTAVATTGKRTTTTTTGTTLTPVQQKLQRNTNLASKLAGRLPAGTDLMTAAEGFRNLGQFVAAVNVSNNLGIPFADLKNAMVVEGMSLGQAIKSERPTADSTTEVRRAESDATRLISSLEDASTTPKKKASSKTAKKNTKGQR